MSLRFRKSIKLAPGIRMNFSGSGVSWTLGPRGASVGIGQRGTFLNTGIPGTGLYSRQSIGGSGSSRRGSQKEKVTFTLTVIVDDEGNITFRDANGQPVSDKLIEAAKKQQGDAIKNLIQGKCNEINGQVEALGLLHIHSPSPTSKPSYTTSRFDISPPYQPVPKKPGFFARCFKSKVAKIEAENAAAEAAYQAELATWNAEKQAFEIAEAQKTALVFKAVSGEVEGMESFIGEILADIVWPRETLVSFEVRDGGCSIAIDVDLPEIEDMPTKTASVPQRGFKLSIKEMGVTWVQKLYAHHIHAIAFRLIAEAFGMLPTVQVVVLSGYSQRHSKTTGALQNEYLLSVRVARDDWERIDFTNLAHIDVVEALTQFELRREMSKSALFKAIEPI